MKPEVLLKLSQHTSTVAFHRFVLLCKDRADDIFCFYEGKDSPYYYPRIIQVTNRKSHPIICGNKKNVLDVYRLISSNVTYKKYLTAYFVDKDFDPTLNDKRIFETPCYSIENLYVTKKTVSEILKNEFNLIEEDDEYKSAMKSYEENFCEYIKKSILFNSWYGALKQKKLLEGLKSTNVCLEEKIPTEFLDLKIGSISSTYTYEDIIKKYPQAIKVSKEEVEEYLKELRKINYYHRYLRGKFQFFFLYKFLKFLIDDANGKKGIIKKKTKFNLDKSNMYSQLSIYAITPSSLIDYLSTFKIN